MNAEKAQDALLNRDVNVMNDLGKLMFVAGLLMALIGAVLWTGFGRNWIGRLPGDIHFARGNTSFYFPVVTCILVSILLTLVLRIFRK